MKTPPPRSADDGQAQAPPKLWPKQGAASPDSAPKVPAADKAKPASPTTATPKLIAKEKARPPPLVPEETETQEEPPLPAPAAPPTEPTPPKTSFPPAAGEARQTPKASFPPAAGEARQSEVDRAPSLAAEAPASRVGSVMNDADGNPLFCLVQLWACRKRCESCENAFCQATFADRTSAYHARHRCRDCKRAEGRAAAHQQSSWPSQSWESLGANPGVRIGERIGASLALKVRHPLGARLSQFCRFVPTRLEHSRLVVKNGFPLRPVLCDRIQHVAKNPAWNRLLQHARQFRPRLAQARCAFGESLRDRAPR